MQEADSFSLKQPQLDVWVLMQSQLANHEAIQKLSIVCSAS